MNRVYRKTIKTFLIDGVPTGRMSVELSNWTGKAYKIPRNRLKECKDRPDLNGTGVYFLFGEDENQHDVAYIGEAEDVLDRLDTHLRQKDFWTEVVVFISKDDNLNKAHIKYLEHHFYRMAIEASRYKITNDRIPALPVISESDEAEMEEYMANSQLLIGTLGHRLFEKMISVQEEDADNDKIFYIKAARGAKAQMMQTSEGFVVLEGSQFADPVVDSFPAPFHKLRDSLLDQEKLIRNNERLILAENHRFSSPSTAATIVMGRSANGLTEWHLRDGMTLKDVESIE